jgi:hypothetical protein
MKNVSACPPAYCQFQQSDPNTPGHGNNKTPASFSIGPQFIGNSAPSEAETYSARNTKIEYCEAIAAKSSIFVFGKFYGHLTVPKIK